MFLFVALLQTRLYFSLFFLICLTIELFAPANISIFIMQFSLILVPGRSCPVLSKDCFKEYIVPLHSKQSPSSQGPAINTMHMLSLDCSVLLSSVISVMFHAILLERSVLLFPHFSCRYWDRNLVQVFSLETPGDKCVALTWGYMWAPLTMLPLTSTAGRPLCIHHEGLQSCLQACTSSSV